jgi:hypothetical protein
MSENRSIQQLGRSSRRAAVVSFLGVLIVIAALIYSANHLRNLQQQNNKAEAELNDKRTKVESLNKEIEMKQTQLKILNEAQAQLGASVDPKLANEADQALQAAILSNAKAGDVLPRVYFHIREERQRENLKPLVDALIAKGFSVPRVIFVGTNAPLETQLRYFQRGEQESQDLTQILAILRDKGLKIEDRYIPPSAELVRIRPRHYEVWLGKDF